MKNTSLYFILFTTLFFTSLSFAEQCGSYDETKVVDDAIRCGGGFKIDTDWSYCDLSNRNLSDYDFSNADLTGANFQGSILTRAIFDNAEISNANFNASELTGSIFRSSNVQGSDFRAISLDLSYARVGLSGNYSPTNIEGACLDIDKDDLFHSWNEGIPITDIPIKEKINAVTAMQSSTEGNRHAHYAIDGNYITFSETAKQNNRWLMIDLGKIHYVSSLTFHAGPNRSRDFELAVSDTRQLDLSNISPWQELTFNQLSTNAKKLDIIEDENGSIKINHTLRFIWIKATGIEPNKQFLGFTEIDIYGESTPIANKSFIQGILGDSDPTYTETNTLINTLTQNRKELDYVATIKTTKQLQTRISELKNIADLIVWAIDSVNDTCNQFKDVFNATQILNTTAILQYIGNKLLNKIGLEMPTNCDLAIQYKLGRVKKSANAIITSATKYDSYLEHNKLQLQDVYYAMAENINTVKNAKFSIKTINKGVNSAQLEAEARILNELLTKQASDIEKVLNKIKEIEEYLNNILSPEDISAVNSLKLLSAAADKVKPTLEDALSLINEVSSVLTKELCLSFDQNTWFGTISVNFCFSLNTVLSYTSYIPYLNSFERYAYKAMDWVVDPILDLFPNLPMGFLKTIPDILTDLIGEVIETEILSPLSQYNDEVNLTAIKQLIGIDHLTYRDTTYDIINNADYDTDGLSNIQERFPDSPFYYSSIWVEDTDLDGISDSIELSHDFLSPTNSEDALLDQDGDGLSNLQELILGSSMIIVDTDSDGLDDGLEAGTMYSGTTHQQTPGQLYIGMSPTNANDALLDYDNDGLSNKDELLAARGGITSIYLRDSDNDKLGDLQEFDLNSDPNNSDTDGDSLIDGVEIASGLNHLIANDPLADTDNDGLADILEAQFGTSLINGDDSDGDSLVDDWEIGFIGDLNANENDDLDGDGLTNLTEQALGTHPKVKNSRSGEQLGIVYADSHTSGAPAYNWIDISTTGTAVSYAPVPGGPELFYPEIGFNFYLLNSVYSRVRINKSGSLWFTEEHGNQHSNELKLLQILNADLDKSKVYYQLVTQGDARTDEDIFVIQFEIYEQGALHLPIKYQAILGSQSNKITVNYQQTLRSNSKDNLAVYAQIGLVKSTNEVLAYSHFEPALSTKGTAIVYNSPFIATLTSDNPLGKSKAKAGEFVTYTINILNRLERTVTYDLDLANGYEWESQLQSNQITIAPNTNSSFNVTVRVPLNTTLENYNSPLHQDEVFVRLTDIAQNIVYYVNIATENVDYVKSSLDTRKNTFVLKDTSKIDLNWFVSQGIGFGWPELLSDWDYSQQRQVFDITENIDGVQWLFDNTGIQFTLKPSIIYELLTAGITSGLVDRPTYGLSIHPSAASESAIDSLPYGTVIYYYDGTGQLNAFSPDDWYKYNDISGETTPENRNTILFPLFANGSQNDLDGLINDRVIYKLLFGVLTNPPLAEPDAYTFEHSQAFVVNLDNGVLANDLHIAADNRIEIMAEPNHGELTMANDGSFTYQHDGGLTNTDSFTYRLRDSKIISPPVVVNLTIIHKPTYREQGELSLVLDEGEATTAYINITDNNPGLIWQIETQPEFGEMILNGTDTGVNIYYQSDDNNVSDVQAVILVTDTDGNVARKAISIAVNEINDKPDTLNDQYQVLRGTSLSELENNGVLFNDIDVDSSTLTVELIATPQNGDLLLNSDGTFTYQHNGTYTNSIDSFTYRVFDGEIYSDNTLVTLTITDDDTTARATPDYYEVQEGQALVINVANGVNANDEKTLPIEVVNAPAHGELTLNSDGSFNYTHLGAETNSDLFSYKLIGSNASESIGLAYITVLPVNDAPLIDTTPALPQETLTSIDEGVSTVIDHSRLELAMYGTTSPLAFVINAADTDSEILTWEIVSISEGTIDLVIKENGQTLELSFLAPVDLVSQVTVNLSVYDELGASDSLEVVINVHPENTLPVAIDHNLTVEYRGEVSISFADILTSASDLDGDTLSLAFIKAPVLGQQVFNSDGNVTYRHLDNHSGVDTITYSVFDGKEHSEPAQVIITVEPSTIFDSDFDYVPDELDAFPNDPSEQYDTDLDGIGNNKDLDDDNDGIPDIEDSAPLVASIDDKLAPVFLSLPPLTIEATALLSEVEIALPHVSDSIDNLVTVKRKDNLEEFPLGQHTIIWVASDQFDNQREAKQIIIIQDSIAPELTINSTIKINATDIYTTMENNLIGEAIDLVDGEIDLVLSNKSLPSGIHILSVTATDKSGNTTEPQEVSVVITPYIELPAQVSYDGESKLKVPFSLSGNANDTVVIQYQIELADGTLTNEEERLIEGVSSILLLDAPSDNPIVSVSINSVENAFIKHSQSVEVILIQENRLPALSVALSQANNDSASLVLSKGDVTVDLLIDDANSRDEHIVAWQLIDSPDGVDGRGDYLTYTISENQLQTGRYVIAATVTEVIDDEVQLQSTYMAYEFFINAELTKLSSDNDSDGDGLSDEQEGHTDSDGDGINDFADNNDIPHIQIYNQDGTMIKVPVGLFINRVSNIAQFINNNPQEATAKISLDTLKLITIKQTSEANRQKVEKDFAEELSNFVPQTGIIDFHLFGLELHGDLVKIIYQWPAAEGIPPALRYRKYTQNAGWFDFVEDGDNQLASTSLIDGVCPTVDAAQWQSGLNSGDQCIRLSIVDGGANDDDGIANGSIIDPGVFSTPMQVNTAPIITMVADVHANEGKALEVSAVVSDAQGDTITYQWQQVSGIDTDILDATSNTLNITLPNVDEDSQLVFSLIASDGSLATESQVLINVKNVHAVTKLPEVPTNQTAPTTTNTVSTKSSSGGSITWLLLLIMLITFIKCCQQHRYKLSVIKVYLFYKN